MILVLEKLFTQTDPLEADVGSAYPSAYVYGNNNPTMFVDPSGLRGQAACGKPGVVGSLNLFADSAFDALPFVSVGSSACENSQVTQMFSYGATAVVPKAEFVGKAAAGSAVGLVAAPLLVGAGAITAGCVAGGVGSVASVGGTAIGGGNISVADAGTEIAVGAGIGCATAGAGKAFKAAKTARAAKPPKYPIELRPKDISHAIKRHFVPKEGKSTFSPSEDFWTLMKASEKVKPRVQKINPNMIRIVKAGRNVGVDVSTGQPTSIYTVVTRSDGSFVTMYPGRP
jgi:hypothetical protein